jgi:hypothetical protein
MCCIFRHVHLFIFTRTHTLHQRIIYFSLSLSRQDLLAWSDGKINVMFTVKKETDLPRAIATIIEEGASERSFIECPTPGTSGPWVSSNVPSSQTATTPPHFLIHVYIHHAFIFLHEYKFHYNQCRVPPPIACHRHHHV